MEPSRLSLLTISLRHTTI